MEYIIYIYEKIFTFCILTLQLFLQLYSPYQVLLLKVIRSKLNYCCTNLVGQKFEVSYSLVFLPKQITQNQPHFPLCSIGGIVKSKMPQSYPKPFQ